MTGVLGFQGSRRDRTARIFDPPCVQRLAPARFKVALDDRLPRLAHRFVRAQPSAHSAAPGKRGAPSCRHRADRSSAAQSKPFRHKRAHPTTTPENAPRECASAKSARSRPHASRDARPIFALSKAAANSRSAGAVVNRIGIQNHQPIHLARIQIGNQRLEIGNLICKAAGFSGVECENRLDTIVAERAVDRQRQRRNRRDPDTAPESPRSCPREPSNPSPARPETSSAHRSTHTPGASTPATPTAFANSAAKAGISLARSPSRCSAFNPGRRRRALDRVQPVQLLRLLAPLRILADQLVEAGKAAPERKSASSETITSASAQIVLNIQPFRQRTSPQSPGRTAPASPWDTPPAPPSTAAPASAK